MTHALLTEEIYGSLLERYSESFGDLDLWRRSIVDFFSLHPSALPHVHSVKSRQKDPRHLRDKIQRKWSDANPITTENFFDRITDLAGVRVLLLHQAQFSSVKALVENRISRKEWFLFEKPKAYTWDPEASKFFESLGYQVERKDSHYTSVHYVVKQYEASSYYCEIQVRTLFEEIWGEVDHKINYPSPTPSQGCRDQILVLAKLIGAGSRLVDSIFAAHASVPPDNAHDSD